MTQKVDYEKIKDLSGSQIMDSFKELNIPEFPEGSKDREEFLKFAKLEPGSKERFDFINERKKPEETHIEPPSDLEGPDNESAPSADPQENIKEPEGEKITLDHELKEPVVDNATASDDKPMVSVEDLMNQIAKKDSEISNFRKQGGKSGRKIKELQKQIDELNSKINEQTSVSEPLKKPSKPKRPKLKDYDNDPFDENYLSAMEQYDDKMDVYENQLERYYFQEPDYVKSLRNELNDVKNKSEQAYTYVSNSSQIEAENNKNKAWEDMWDKTKSIQEALNIKTSVDMKNINYYAKKLLNRDAVDANNYPIYTDAEIAEAQYFYNNLSKTDKENFEKTTKVVNSYFDFSNNLPKNKYDELDDDSVIMGIAKKNGLSVNGIKILKMSESEKADALSKKQKENENYVSGMDGSQIGVGDPKLGSEQSNEQKTNKLRDMAATVSKNPGVVKEKHPSYDKAFAEEFSKLRFELFGHSAK